MGYARRERGRGAPIRRSGTLLLAVQLRDGSLHAALHLRVVLESAGTLTVFAPERDGRPARKGHVYDAVLLPWHHIDLTIDRDAHEPEEGRPAALTKAPQPQPASPCCRPRLRGEGDEFEGG